MMNWVFYDPHKLQKAFHESQKYVLMHGRRSAKNYATAQICKIIPRRSIAVVVPDLKQMDIMISLGVKPSQIMLPSEFTNQCDIHICSISGEDIDNGGSPCA